MINSVQNSPANDPGSKPINAEFFIDNKNLLQAARSDYRHLNMNNDYTIDTKKLLDVISDSILETHHMEEICVIEATIFDSLPTNYDPRSQSFVESKRMYLDKEEQKGVTVSICYTDYRGNRTEPKYWDDDFKPKEKGVDAEMIVKIMQRVTASDGPELIIIVSGDADFVPVIKASQKLGKTVLVAHFQSQCSMQIQKLLDPNQFVLLDGNSKTIRRNTATYMKPGDRVIGFPIIPFTRNINY